MYEANIPAGPKPIIIIGFDNTLLPVTFISLLIKFGSKISSLNLIFSFVFTKTS